MEITSCTAPEVLPDSIFVSLSQQGPTPHGGRLPLRFKVLMLLLFRDNGTELLKALRNQSYRLLSSSSSLKDNYWASIPGVSLRVSRLSDPRAHDLC
ncbi:hypothetical protein RRG08_003251 [Elysia crispata]|uniref:Uncharacterized protein n=1 Tax=Elysia crispata TaxID=231223 RepID=A0AAE1AZJ5_9GAST|nr:hypothetical protein RRG08_003251 [Elysia crispata]